jgi:hypothetical protein
MDEPAESIASGDLDASLAASRSALPKWTSASAGCISRNGRPRSPRPASCTCCVTASASRTPALGRDRQSPQTRLHRPHRGSGKGAVRRVHRRLGRQVSGDHPAGGGRLGRVHPVLGLRSGDPPDHLLHQRHRKRERPDPPSGQSPRPFPQRASCVEVRLHGRDESGPHRRRTSPLDHALETSSERLRDRLRRPPGRRTQVTQHNPSYTERWTDPITAPY